MNKPPSWTFELVDNKLIATPTFEMAARIFERSKELTKAIHEHEEKLFFKYLDSQTLKKLQEQINNELKQRGET
jgi:prephenate dehydrogenase